MWSIYEIIHIFELRLKIKVKNDHRRKFSSLSNWKEEAWKKSSLQRDSSPWPPQYRCDALPTELWSHTLGARPIYWVHISREEWHDAKYIWNNSYIWTAVVDQSEDWSSQEIFQFKQLERRSLKKSSLQRDSNPWPPRIPVRCSTNWALKPHIGSEVNLLSSYLPWGVKWCEVYMK